MKFIYLYYQVIGSAIIISGINPLYKAWILLSVPFSILAIYKIPRDFVIYKKKEFFSNNFLRLALIVLIFFSSITALINADLTIIPSFLLISLITAYYYKENEDLYKKYFKFIAYFGSFVIFIKLIFFGKSLDDIFMFSKNMIPIIFVPYIFNFIDKKSFKERNLNKIFDKLIILFLIMIFLLTISISNIIFALFIFLAIISPKHIGINHLFRQKITYKLNIFSKFFALFGIVYLAIRYIFGLSYQSLENYMGYIPALISGYWSGKGIENPRLDIIQDYLNFDNFYQIIFGKHVKVFEYFSTRSFSAQDLFNPHNSAITLHNTCGIFGFTIILILVFASLKILFNNSIAKGIFFLAILLRGSADSILIATGVSSFIIYLSIFKPNKSLKEIP